MWFVKVAYVYEHEWVFLFKSSQTYINGTIQQRSALNKGLASSTFEFEEHICTKDIFIWPGEHLTIKKRFLIGRAFYHQREHYGALRYTNIFRSLTKLRHNALSECSTIVIRHNAMSECSATMLHLMSKCSSLITNALTLIPMLKLHFTRGPDICLSLYKDFKE